ncbi:MAG: HD domain-containing protein [Desulfobacteraceae bacterium]|nr:HD domain-containing protein [Desulfobacteraceae bacterium]
MIYQSAGERIRAELFKILQTSDAYSVISQMAEHRLLFEIFPELMALKGCEQNRHHAFDVFDHTLSALYHLEKFMQSSPDISMDTETAGLLKFAILLHDIGKPACKTLDESGNAHFYGHEQISANMAAIICERLRCSNAESRTIDTIIRNHLRPLLLFPNPSQRAVTRFFMKFGENTPLLLYHAIADDRGKGVSENSEFTDFAHDLIRQFEQRFTPRLNIPPLISGHDLIEIFGLRPSPMFREILTMIAEEQFSGNINSKEEALNLTEQFLRHHS